jgi:hypothetical protein
MIHALRRLAIVLLAIIVGWGCIGLSLEAAADESPTVEPTAGPDVQTPPDIEVLAEQIATEVVRDGQDRRRLDPRYDVWVDMKSRHVILLGEVCLREGGLELLACLRGTKEHESILSVNTKAFLVHAALLAVGAEAGHPVEFNPEYRGAVGTEIDVALYWTDAEGKRQRQWARDWVREYENGNTLCVPWVFGGSGYWEDELINDITGERKTLRHYKAEEGDLICVSNFPSAMLDLPIESSQSAQSLLYEAYTERIPPVDTKITIVLIPRLEKADAASE